VRPRLRRRHPCRHRHGPPSRPRRLDAPRRLRPPGAARPRPGQVRLRRRVQVGVGGSSPLAADRLATRRPHRGLNTWGSDGIDLTVSPAETSGVRAWYNPTTVATSSSEGWFMTPAPNANVLLVDDQPANLLALEAMLGGLGYDLVRAHSGPEALRLL